MGNEINLDGGNKVAYFYNLWRELIENFNKTSYGLQLRNPQVVLRDIIDEVEYNDFRNNDNKKFFQGEIDNIVKNNFIIKRKYKTEFEMIRKKFNENKFYLMKLCEQAIKIFTNGDYFLDLHRELKDILLEEEWGEHDKEKIQLLTEHIIVEFIIKGYTLETIEGLIKNIFKSYNYITKKLVSTNIPFMKTCYEDYMQEDQLNEEEYSKALIEEISKLSLEDRIDKIKEYYLAEPEEYFVIFRVEGMKGQVDVNVGPVNFYCPWKKRIVKNELYNRELFNEEVNHDVINAAVKVKSIDGKSRALYAITEIEKALDILRSIYISKEKFKINRGQYLIVDLEGVPKFESMSADSVFQRIHNSLDMKEQYGSVQMVQRIERISKYVFKSNRENTVEEKRIIQSLHWFRKAEESENYEDKLVNYWITIESLLEFKNSLKDGIIDNKESENKFTLARAIIPVLMSANYVYGIGWDLYWKIDKLINTVENGEGRLKLPNEVIEKCNLNPSPNTTIYLEQFINNSKEMVKYINNDIIIDNINFIHEFYSKSSNTKAAIEERIKDTKNDILLVYRYRNKIVHNAHYDNIFLPYYVNKARVMASVLLSTVCEDYDMHMSRSIEDIIILQYIKCNDIIEKLTNNIKINLFDENLFKV